MGGEAPSLTYTGPGQVSRRATDALLWCGQNGIISGDGQSLLHPKDRASRAQVVQMLKNYPERG